MPSPRDRLIIVRYTQGERSTNNWNPTVERLFEFEVLPPWDPVLMFELFKLHRLSQATPDQVNDFAKQCMILTASVMSRDGWCDRLDQINGASDTALSIVWFIVQRVDRFNCHKPIETLPVDQGYRWLISSLQTCIRRKLLDEIAKAKVGKADDSSLDEALAPSLEPDLDRLANVLSDDATIDRLIIGADGDVDALIDLIKVQVSEICTRNSLLAYSQLSDQIRSKITAETASLITFRLNRCVRSHAQELA